MGIDRYEFLEGFFLRSLEILRFLSKVILMHENEESKMLAYLRIY